MANPDAPEMRRADAICYWDLNGEKKKTNKSKRNKPNKGFRKSVIIYIAPFASEWGNGIETGNINSLCQRFGYIETHI